MEYQLINQPDSNLSVIEQILYNRGIELKDIKHYLNTTDEDILSPSLLDNIDESIKIIFNAIKEKKQMSVCIDSDGDGFTSSSLLLNYLHHLVPNYIENYVTYYTHEGKQHGVILDEIPPWTEILIVPDAGTNDSDACAALAARGIPVVVIDHHEKENNNPSAYIVNNHTCGYPNKTLSGAGVVWKVCCRIDELLGTNYAQDLTDLAGFGCIGDVMDLRDFETRRLIEMGMSNIKNPFLQAMVEKQSYSLKGEITPIGIAFYIVPFINAVVRMGSMKDKILMFEAMLDWKGNELIPSTKRGCKGEFETRATQACRNASNIKSHQQKARDEAMEKIDNLIQAKELNNHKILTICLPPDYKINKNLTGLVANMLMSKYNKPVLLLNQTEDSWSGSARGLNNSNFTDFKDFCEKSKMTDFCLGHQGAFGFSISQNKIEDFITYADKELADYDFSPVYKVDYIFDNSSFNGNIIIDIAQLKHLWGQGLEEARIAIERLKVTDNIILMSPDKNPTMKIQLSNGVSLIKFKSSVEEVENLRRNDGMTTYINIVGRCEINKWNGNITPQLMIDDYEVVGYEYDF